MDVHAACDPEAIQCGQRAAKNQEHLWGWGTHATAAPLLPEGFHDSQSPYGYQDNVQPPVDINILRLKTPTVEASCWPQDQNGRNSTSWHKKKSCGSICYVPANRAGSISGLIFAVLPAVFPLFPHFQIAEINFGVAKRSSRVGHLRPFFRPRQKRANPPFFNFLGC